MRTPNIQRAMSSFQLRLDLDARVSIRRRPTPGIVRWTFVFFSLVFFALTGCCPPVPPPPPKYTGPTDPMETVVSAINRNSAAIPTLWAQLEYTATLVDRPKGTAESVAGDGALLYASPISLLLTGNKDIAGQVFELGSNGTEFWVKLRTGGDSYNYWWGHYANLGKPGCKPIPIRPDMVLHVLGIGTYQPNFREQPVPVMRYDNDSDAYIFDHNITNGDHWQTQEEIWYARDTKLPMRVLLYDDIGRVALKADLSEQAPVQVVGLDKERWPKIARHYDLLFPDSGTKISFSFDQPALNHQGRHGNVSPNPGSFKRLEPEGNTKVIQIDADCVDTAMLGKARLCQPHCWLPGYIGVDAVTVIDSRSAYAVCPIY